MNDINNQSDKIASFKIIIPLHSLIYNQLPGR